MTPGKEAALLHLQPFPTTLTWPNPREAAQSPHGPTFLTSCLQEPQWRRSATLAHLGPGGEVPAAERTACGGPGPEGPQAPVLDADSAQEDAGVDGDWAEARGAVAACV